DFSDNARGALRYAAAVAAHFHTPLTLLAVNDPLLEEAAALTAGPAHLTEDTRRELERFFSHTFERPPKATDDVRLEVLSGKPAAEILRVSRERACDLIVMGSHGSTGFRKLFFGSTTERVLRETSVPVLVTPGNDPGPLQLHDVRHAVRRVLTPVDLSGGAADRNAGLIVMGLHSSPLLGPRMGSVTYRVLCLAHRLVLALPPGAS